MHTQVSFIHVENSDKLKAYAEKKAQRIERFLPEASVVHVLLKLDKLSHRAEINTQAYSVQMSGRAKSSDMYNSIDRAVDKLEKQLHRYHDKLKNHRVSEGRRQGLSVQMFSGAAEGQDLLPHSQARIVETQQVEARPMLVDEAVMHMNLAQKNVLIFLNAKTDQLNVLQRKKGNDYILTEAH